LRLNFQTGLNIDGSDCALHL